MAGEEAHQLADPPAPRQPGLLQKGESPQVARVRPSTAKAGAHVVVEGLALTHASILFGGHAATVVSRSGTAATVVVPAGSGKVTVRATGALGDGKYRAAFTYAP